MSKRIVGLSPFGVAVLPVWVLLWGFVAYYTQPIWVTGAAIFVLLMPFIILALVWTSPLRATSETE